MTKKKKYLSRNEAAELLEVQPQSISNYAERGLIRTVHSRTNDFIRFPREDIEKLMPHIEEIKNQEEAINEYKECLERERQELEDAHHEQCRLLKSSTLSVSFTKQLFEDCYCLLVNTQDRCPAKVLIRVLNGENPNWIAEDLEITHYEVVKHCKKALKAFRLLPDYERMYIENDKLRSMIRDAQSSYNLLCEKYEVLAMMYKEATEEGEEEPSK